MMVSVNYEPQLRAAYRAGVAATILWLQNGGEKPDFEKFMERQRKLHPAVARL
jgi:CII-binding regulator of phage lambda lysogenization HflD